MGMIYFDIAAVFINLLSIYIFFSRSRLFIDQTKYFSILLVVSLFSSLFDILGVVTYAHAPAWSLLSLYGINALYYLFQNTIPPVFTLFVFSLGGRNPFRLRYRRAIIMIPWIIAVAVILSTPWTGFAFRFDSSLRYLRGPFAPLFYVNIGLYAAMIMSSQLRERRRLPRENRLAVSLLLPLCLVPVCVQMLFPSTLIVNAGIALAELIILLTIQDFGRFVDSSSGLFNRNGLVSQLDLVMLNRKPFDAYLIVLDSVKFLKHVLGSEVFNALEREIAARIFGAPRSDSFAAQLGVARFVFIVGDADRSGRAGEAILDHLRRPWEIGGRVFSISARVCRIRFPEDTKDSEKIFQALYNLTGSRKRYRSNEILSLADLSLADTGRQLAVSQAIRHALSSGGFELHFQPIVSAQTGKVVSAEALLRLKDQALGWISPAEFIPLAEQNGSIHRIGDFVLEVACEFLSKLRESGLKLGYLEVNLSAMQCVQSNLHNRLLSVAQRWGLDPGDLCFEITETAANLSPSIMKKNIELLSASGFSIAMDDFGTGYSNIGMLMDLPFRVVKLDRSMVVGLDRSESGRKGLEGIVAMFTPLETELVAEGVETGEQLEALKGMGVDLIQGFFFSKALPPEDFKRFMLEREALCT